MRRALGLAGLVLAVASGVDAQTVSARLGGELTGLYGTQLSAPVVVDMSSSGGQRLGSYTARVSWPTRVLSFCYYCSLDSMLGTFAAPQVNTDSVGEGVLRFSSAAPLGAEGQVVVARLPFSVVFDSAATLDLSFSEMSASGTFTNLLPILTAQGGQFCPARGRYGDLDSDGRANSRDALFVLSNVVGLPLDTSVVRDVGLADVDADGQVTSRDALIILSYAVGLGIPGQRVLVLAASSCASGSPRFIAVAPDTAELVPGQPVLAVVTATDSAGRPVSLTNTTWRSSDPNIAVVEGNGVVTARAAGTVDIIAEAGPGLLDTLRVNVIARRPNWYVNLTAIGSPVQLGTAARPYAQPADAFRHAGEGDTIRIASGTYIVTDDGELWHGAVIIGGTPGDTTTRPVLRDNSDYAVLWLRGGQRTEVHNVVFENPYEAIDIEAIRTLVLRDVRVHWPYGSWGYGVYHCGDVMMDTLRIERSVFESDSGNTGTTGYGIEIDGCVSPRSLTLLEVRDSKFRNLDEGIYFYDVDSLHIERNLFDGIYWEAIYGGYEYSGNFAALVVRNTRIVRNYYDAVYAYGLRRAVIDSSYIESRYDGTLYLEGDYYGGQMMDLVVRDDTLDLRAGASYDEWLGVWAADSVLVSDVLVRGVPDTAIAIQSYFEDTNWARIQRTRFVDVGYGSYLIEAYDVRRLEIDSVEATACGIAACWGANGVYVSGSLPRTTSLLRSKFQNIAYPFEGRYAGALYDIHNVTIDSAYTGMYFDDVDSLNVTDNVLRRLTYRGIYVADQAGARGPLVIASDSISCASGGYNGIEVSYARLAARGNVVTSCANGYGLTGYGLRTGSRIVGNTFRQNYYGIGVQGDTVTVALDSNAISQANTAVYAGGPRVTAVGNNVRTNSYGFYVYTYAGLKHRLDGNAFQGNTTYAVYSYSDSVDARGNWWGVNGAAPGTSGADAVSSYVNAENPLGSEPSVPPLAPPAPGAPLVARAASPPPAPAALAALAAPARSARTVPAATRTPSNAELAARAAERQARQERQVSGREQRRAARQATQEQRRAADNAPRQ